MALLVVLRALVEQNMTGATPWMAFGIMAVSVAGAALCWYLAHNSEGHANYRMCAEKRVHIGERMKYMPMGYFNAQSLGRLTAAATSTMEDLESMSFAVIARTVVGMIRTTIFSLAILCFDWRIAGIPAWYASVPLGQLTFAEEIQRVISGAAGSPRARLGGRCAGIHTGHERGARFPWRQSGQSDAEPHD